MVGLGLLDDRAERPYRPSLVPKRAAADTRLQGSTVDAIDFVTAELVERFESQIAGFVAEFEEGLEA